MGMAYLAEREKRILVEDLRKFYEVVEPIYAWRLCKIMEVVTSVKVNFYKNYY